MLSYAAAHIQGMLRRRKHRIKLQYYAFNDTKESDGTNEKNKVAFFSNDFII